MRCFCKEFKFCFMFSDPLNLTYMCLTNNSNRFLKHFFLDSMIQIVPNCKN